MGSEHKTERQYRVRGNLLQAAPFTPHFSIANS